MHAPDLQHVQDLFSDHGLRCTRQRVSLYQALAASEAHPTADELYHTVAHDLPGISVATVYNCLEAFCKAGIVQKLPPEVADLTDAAPSRAARYDATTHQHLHIRCLRTGQVRDVPDDLGRQLLDHIPADVVRRLEREMGFDVQQVKIELVGECR